MIKILLLSGFFLSASLLQAAEGQDKSMLNYQGQAFSDKDVCEAEAQDVALRMEEIGYRVFDHTCLNSIFGERYTVAVKYEYDVMSTVEELESTMSSMEKCETVHSETLVDFSQISADIISAYCVKASNSGAKLKVDYKKNDDFIRSYNHTGVSASYDQCLQNKQRLEQVLMDNQVRPLVSFCSEKSFKIKMHYTIKAQRSLEAIQGKKIERRSACEVSDQSVLANFDENDLKGLITFCSKRGGQLYKSVLYLDELFSKVDEFKGFSRTNLAQCEDRLANAAEMLEAQGHAPLYQYCQSAKDSYTPVIHYRKKSSL